MVKLYSIFGLNTILLGAFSLFFYVLTYFTSGFWGLNTLILGIFLVVCGVLIMILPRRKVKKKEKKSELKNLMISPDFKNTFTGMAISEGKVDLNQLCSLIGLSFELFRLKIFELIGSGKINGTIENGNFIPIDDIAESTDALLNGFMEWEEKGEGKKI